MNAAKSTTAWIGMKDGRVVHYVLLYSLMLCVTVSGGTDVGVMRSVGEANRQFATEVPTIGFASFDKIHNNDIFNKVSI